MARAVRSLSPVIITVRMPIRRSSSKRSRMPSLTTSLSSMTPSTRAAVVRPRPAAAACRRRRRSRRRPRRRRAGRGRPATRTQRGHRAGGALAQLPAVGEVDAAHPRLRGERHEVARRAGRVRSRSPYPRLGQDDDAAALGGLVGQRGELGGVGDLVRPSAPPTASELRRLPVAEGDGAGLVQQQGAHVAGGLHGAAAHGQHVALHEPVHAGDADGRQQRADGGRDEADDQRDEDQGVAAGAGVDRERLQGDRRPAGRRWSAS